MIWTPGARLPVDHGSARNLLILLRADYDARDQAQSAGVAVSARFARGTNGETMNDEGPARRLEQVIALWLSTQDGGGTSGRTELLAANPDLAAELQAFFREHDRLSGITASLHVPAEHAPGSSVTGVPGPDPSTQPFADDVRSTAVENFTVSQPAMADETLDRQNGARPNSALVRYFGDYELLGELGQGGMGVVYKARQVSLNRTVALKMLKSDVLATLDEQRRFQNEAEAVALLDHPNVVPILEVGIHEGRRYFSMKLVSGASLDKTLEDYAANPRAAARIVATAAQGVHHAHQRGILHRDLKPANILVDDQGEPHVTDFGLAKRVEGDSELTHSGAILGTPSYMAPEQASGVRGAVTTASDVYGLGAVLYALLAGRAPFRGDSVIETLQQVRDQAPVPPSKLRANVPRDLEIIALNCLEKLPSRRYTSALALSDDLCRWLDGRPITARRVGPLGAVGCGANGNQCRRAWPPRSCSRSWPVSRESRWRGGRPCTGATCWRLRRRRPIASATSRRRKRPRHRRSTGS